MDYMDRIMNKENDYNHNEGDAVEGPVVRERVEEVVQVINKYENRKSPWIFRCIIGDDCC